MLDFDAMAGLADGTGNVMAAAVGPDDRGRASERDGSAATRRTERATRRFQPVEELMKRFMSREEGSTSIEFVLWLPLLVAVLMVAVDASVLYMRQSNLWQVSRDTARIVSRHGMTEGIAEAYARSEVQFGDYVPAVDVVIDGQLVTVSMAASLDQVAPLGIFNFAVGDLLVASITQSMEPR
jgi:Flp pilus assembly pilin Flp